MDLNQEMFCDQVDDDLASRSEAESGRGSGNSTSSFKQLKSCSDCHTTRTPLWRGGPAGPKSLCNACGIKYNKKRREMLGVDTGRRKDKGKKKGKSNGGSRQQSSQVGKSLRVKVMGLGGEDMLRRRSGKLIGKLKEEEQAAILLMALSCGSVYA